MARPRTFDVDEAIDVALQLFWRKGYEGTSLTDLTAAMGINRPSFYAAFESKQALFDRVLERYAEGPASAALRALEAATARGVVEQLLALYTDTAGIPGRPRGCLLVQGALVSSDDAAEVRETLQRRRAAVEAALRARLERAKKEGDLPANEDAGHLARYVWTICQGLAVEAVGGASRAELRRVAERALRAWPSP